VRAEVLSVALGYRYETLRENTGTTYGLKTWVETLRGGTGVLYIGGSVENGGLITALRSIREELAHLGSGKGRELDYGRWMVASRYNLGLATTEELVARVLHAARQGFSVGSIDAVPDVLASFQAAPLIAALNQCPEKGVLSIVGDRIVAARAVAQEWRIQKPNNRGSVSPT